MNIENDHGYKYHNEVDKEKIMRMIKTDINEHQFTKQFY